MDQPTGIDGVLQDLDVGCVRCTGTVEFAISKCYEKLECDLVADLSPLLVDGVESGVSGTACVKKDGDGIVFAGHLEGLLPDTTGGFHIHGGTECGTASTDTTQQGGHYFQGNYQEYKIADDPWVSPAPFYGRWGTVTARTS